MSDGEMTYKPSRELLYEQRAREMARKGCVTVSVDGNGSKRALDGSKLRLDLVPPQFVEGVAKVLGFGAQKYAAHNWMRGIAWSQIAAAVKRHLASFETGEEIDPESGEPHLYHAACGLMFLSWYAHGPARDLHTAQDDRVFIDPAKR